VNFMSVLVAYLRPTFRTSNLGRRWRSGRGEQKDWNDALRVAPGRTAGQGQEDDQMPGRGRGQGGRDAYSRS